MLTEQLGRAVDRLAEVLREPATIIARDAAIKRFEFTFDLSWKVLKAYLEERHGVSCASPLTCLREAFRVGVITDEAWVELVKLRNLTAHTYNETVAVEVYQQLPSALQRFQALVKTLQ